eukprot:Nk52_evm19s305 gene=Nk52_evmTU19s305
MSGGYVPLPGPSIPRRSGGGGRFNSMNSYNNNGRGGGGGNHFTNNLSGEGLLGEFSYTLQKSYRHSHISLYLSLRSFMCVCTLLIILVTLLLEMWAFHSRPDLVQMKILRQVSVIVPTYKERDNLQPLCEQVFAACRSEQFTCEMIIVDDDSQDGSDKVVDELKTEGYDIKIHTRTTERGLSSAVVAGFYQARYDTFLVMDADLSHPPEIVPELVKPVVTGNADFALGSRYIAGGGTSDWPLIRRIISWGATMLARPLVSVSDPMSGFFALRRSVFTASSGRINTMGFKIGLEIMVKGMTRNNVEIPITFKDRAVGQSKLKLKTQLEYVLQLIGLYWFAYPFTVVLGVISLPFILYCVILSLLTLLGVVGKDYAYGGSRIPKKAQYSY